MRQGVAVKLVITMICVTFASTSAGVLLVDDLTDGQTKATVKGGQFSSNGWTPAGAGLGFKLSKTISSGGVQIWVKNFNPPKQCSAEKHHYFTVRTTNQDYRTSSGRTGCCAKSEPQSNCQIDLSDWATFRSGTKYGNQGKILANERGGDSECKLEEYKTYPSLNPSGTVILKITFSSGTASFTMAGQSWGSLGKVSSLEVGWTFIGRDIYHGWPAMNGPIYTKIVVWEGTQPSGLEGLTESGVPTSMQRLTIAGTTAAGTHAERYALTGRKLDRATSAGGETRVVWFEPGKGIVAGFAQQR